MRARGPYSDHYGLRRAPPAPRYDRDKVACPRLAVALRQARRKAGLTQRDMAVQIDVSRPLVAAWESGRRAVSRRHFWRLSNLLREGPYDWQRIERDARERGWPPAMWLPAEETPAKS